MYNSGDWATPFLESRYSITELWSAYIALGGNQSREQVGRYVSGVDQPIDTEHNLLAQALNERLHDLGENWPVPYQERD